MAGKLARPGLAALVFALCFAGFGPARADDDVVAAPPSTVAEMEPNDNPSTNNVAGGNTDFTGNVAVTDSGFQAEPGDDFEDWVSVTITQASTLSATLEVNQADIDMLICRRDGPYTVEGSLAHSLGEGSVDESFTVALQPGTYVIGISAYDPHGPYSTTNYTLSLRGGITTTPGRGDLSVSVTDSPDPAPSGTVVKYIIEVRNAGPDAVSAVVTGSTPDHTTFSFANFPSDGGYSGPSPLETGAFSLYMGNVPVGTSKAGIIYLNANADEGATLTFPVQVSTSSEDPVTTNNAAQSTTTIISSRVAELTWPVPTTANTGPPSLEASLLPPGTPALVDDLATNAPAPNGVTGYKVYRSTQANVQPTPNNIFGSYPPNQTSARVPVGSGKTYFTVTACYGETETEKSNEADVELNGPTITGLTVKGSKLTATGSGFQGPVKVFVDGIEFATAPKIKKGKKVVAKGALANGQTLAQAMSAGVAVRVAIQNADGGMTQLTLAP
jgi:hypothetical protein